MTLTTQNPPRKRIKLTCPEISITDPDESRAFTMTSIKKRLDQGIMPTLTNDSFYSLESLKYSNLHDALEFHQHIQNEFEALPSAIRKAMGNNIHNFESFLKDPQNAALLKKYGLVTTPDATNQQIINKLDELKVTNLESLKKGQKQPE